MQRKEGCRIKASFFALYGWIRASVHRLHQKKQRVFLRGGQKRPGIQEAGADCPSARVARVHRQKTARASDRRASQIFSSDEKDGVMPFLYHEEMVDCGSPERSAS